jgi:hypothetical protein
MNARRVVRAAAFPSPLASFGCAWGQGPAAWGPPPGQATDDFDEYECPNCIGGGESTIDEDVTQ